MGFFRNLFTTAGEVASLTREVLSLQGQLEHERTRNALLEQQIIAERKKKDSVLLKYCDQVSKLNHLPMVFREKVERPAQEPEPLSIVEEERVKYIAEAMRNDDLDRDGDARPIEAYIDAINLDPAKYLS